MLTDVNLSDGIVYQFTINRLFLLNLSVESCSHQGNHILWFFCLWCINLDTHYFNLHLCKMIEKSSGLKQSNITKGTVLAGLGEERLQKLQYMWPIQIVFLLQSNIVSNFTHLKH